MRRDTTLAVIGCGTVGHGITRRLSASGVVDRLARVVFADRARVRPHNAITCSSYAGHVGRFKAELLAELASDWRAGGGRAGSVGPRPSWLNGGITPAARPGRHTDPDGHRGSPREDSHVAIDAVVADVADVAWSDLAPAEVVGAGPLVVVMGLDDWEARMHVAEDLRVYAADAGAEPVLIQVGLDRDQAQVAVLGGSYADPCPACGLSVLPHSEPCVLLADDGTLRRGNLRPEVQAAAVLVEKIVAGLIEPDGAERNWLNTKTNLVARPGSSRWFDCYSRPARARSGCAGPHAPDALPVRWDTVLAPLGQGGFL